MTEKVCVVGSWHLACVHAAGLAELGAAVVQCDSDVPVIDKLALGVPPLFEPDLAELIKKNQEAGRLRFSGDIAGSVANASVVYLADDIKVDNQVPDMAGVWQRFNDIVPNLASGAVLVVSTQVPVGSCKLLAEEFASRAADKRLRLVYHPEFLRLGAAMKLFLRPDYIVLGHNDEPAVRRVLSLYESIDCPKPLMGLSDAEMVKHAANTYVAVSVSFACELAQLADRLGVDAFNVGRALRYDKRVGSSAYVLPGLGFTGGNLERDIAVWKQKAATVGVPTTLLDATLAVNTAQANVPLQLLSAMLGSLGGCTIAIWGLAYKPDSSSIRGSYSVALAKGLVAAGATVRGFDPNIVREEVLRQARIEFGNDRYAICEGADALAIMTNAKVYGDCDYERLSTLMHGKVILDPHGMLDSAQAIAAGFTYSSIGRGYSVKRPN